MLVYYESPFTIDSTRSCSFPLGENDEDMASSRLKRRYHHVYYSRGVELLLCIGRQPDVELSCGSSLEMESVAFIHFSLVFV